MRRLLQIVLLATIAISLLWVGCAHEPDSSNETIKEISLSPSSNLTDQQTKFLLDAVNNYLMVKDALASDNNMETDEASQELIKSLNTLKENITSDTIADQVLIAGIEKSLTAAGDIVGIKDETCEVKRLYFKTLSDGMYTLIKETDLKDIHLYRQYCPMAFNDEGAYWLSKEENIENPYFGKKMLECGEITEIIK